jgi:phospholipase/carboxylesterase
MDISTLARLPASGAPDLLFLLFHGADSDARSMANLAQRLGLEYPQSAVLCVDAPMNSSAISAARLWFAADEPSAAAVALPSFIATVRELQSRFSVAWERTALFGFAQGATMALEAVQAERNLAGRVLAFSGRHVWGPAHAPEDTTHHFFHGMNDAVQPHGPAIDSARRLLALGGDVTADVLPGIAHELHPALIDKAIERLRTFLPKKVWRQAAAQAPLIPRVASSDELGTD